MARHASSGRSRERSAGRKTLQLCKQISRALTYAFSACDDDTIRELYVESVQPAPDAGRLMVTVTPLTEGLDAVQILTRLAQATPFLRGEVAEAIHRKRTPEIFFQVLPHPSARESLPDDR